MSIFEKYAELRAKYPDDIERIENEEAEVKKTLALQDYSQLEATRYLLSMCRKQILEAHIRLARERDLSEEARRSLWNIIDARRWFVDMVAKDYAQELTTIERDLDVELSR